MNRQLIRHMLLGGVALGALGFSNAAMAAGGNILLTGHDNDLHCYYGNAGNACGALNAETTYVRNGSALPVLVIDQGTDELSSDLTAAGVTVVTKAPGAVTAADFNNSLYSAFAVASVTSCGGCDNPIGTGTVLSAFGSAIAAFYDAGGGILGMTSATDALGFAYVPDAAAGSPIGHASGFVATAAGLADIPGFFAVNGDETHNIFPSFSSAYSVAEVDSTDADAAVTLFLSGGTITCTGAGCSITGGGGSVPEPVSISLLAGGLFGIGFARRRLRK